MLHRSLIGSESITRKVHILGSVGVDPEAKTFTNSSIDEDAAIFEIFRGYHNHYRFMGVHGTLGDHG